MLNSLAYHRRLLCSFRSQPNPEAWVPASLAVHRFHGRLPEALTEHLVDNQRIPDTGGGVLFRPIRSGIRVLVEDAQSVASVCGACPSINPVFILRYIA